MSRGSEVLVVGAGIAGTAAALAAARAGARVTVIDGGPGATALATGGLDGESSAREVVEALGVHAWPAAGVRLLTTGGVVRAASGCDAALLDVGAGPVAVARCLRPGWDADALARAWSESRRGGFVPIDVRALRQADERSLPDADFAARHDDEARLGWLELRVREALAASGQAFAAVVLPPCLGVDRPRAAELSRRLGMPCGEAIAAPGGPSGLRFERARDRALAAAEVARAAGHVVKVEKREIWHLALEDGRTLEAGAVVLATGGFLGGGLTYVAGTGGPPVRASVEAPVTLGARGRAIETAGSLFGGPPEEARGTFAAGRALERAGMMAGEDGRCAGAPVGLFAAGEAVADAPRTWLGALDQGARAGRAAARLTGAEGPSRGPGPGSPSPP